MSILSKDYGEYHARDADYQETRGSWAKQLEKIARGDRSLPSRQVSQVDNMATHAKLEKHVPIETTLHFIVYQMLP